MKQKLILYADNTPEDLDELRTAMNGHLWRAVVETMLEYLRVRLKYNELKVEVEKELEEFRAKIFSEMERFGLTRG